HFQGSRGSHSFPGSFFPVHPPAHPSCTSLCSALESAPAAHPSQGLVSSICFYCPLLGSGKGKDGVLGSGISEPHLVCQHPSRPCSHPGEAAPSHGTIHTLTDTASLAPLGDRTRVTVARH
uniref:Uncharacterized protein n=1 Tax=Zonotrichia albicollis TaxID=44394 RepID=A0A8D2MQM1_ZONAL